MFFCLFRGVEGKVENNNGIVRIDKAGGGAEDFDFTGACRCRNNISLNPGAGGDVGDDDSLVRQKAGGVHKGAVNGKAALVMKLRRGNRGVVQFGFQ